MILFPAIDLFEGHAVRLLKGDYAAMTVYNNDPVEVAAAFADAGARYVHVVDLEGARDTSAAGSTPNLRYVEKIAARGELICEVGGGIRSLATVRRYIDAGVSRVILGTAAVENREFLVDALSQFGEHIAVGADVRDGYLALKGWTQQTSVALRNFVADMCTLGVSNIICTDISRDGAMAGTNRALYEALVREFPLAITASGGVSTLDDIAALRDMGLYGAIVGKAYYTGAIDLARALAVASRAGEVPSDTFRKTLPRDAGGTGSVGNVGDAGGTGSVDNADARCSAKEVAR